MTSARAEISSPIALLAAGGALPFAVADSLLARGIKPTIFALKGLCDPARVAAYRHHWIPLGQLGKPIPALGVSAAGLANIASALDATIASLDANPPSSLAEVASHIRDALLADGKTAVNVTFAADSADTLGQTLKLSLQFGSSTGSYRNFCIMSVVCKVLAECLMLEEPRPLRRFGEEC